VTIQSHGVAVCVCGARPNVTAFMEKVGLVDQLGEAAFYPNVSEAILDAAARQSAVMA